MSNEEEPIYDFAPLKRFLQSKGYTIGTRNTYEPFVPEDVTAADVTNGTMSFTADGIFVKGKDGIERQVFLYKKRYFLGYGKLPRYHICKCQIIADFTMMGRDDEYVRANSEPVPVIDLSDHGTKKMVSGLPLCNYCLNQLRNYGNIDSSMFVEMLKSINGEKENLELDLFGYVKDWDSISKQFREKHNYTCQHCGLKIEDDYDKQYIHVHHISGDKTNNDERNLACLCLYCHAHVDNHHEKRLMNGANLVAYKSFVERYYEDAPWGDDFDWDELNKKWEQFLSRHNKKGRKPGSKSDDSHFE